MAAARWMKTVAVLLLPPGAALLDLACSLPHCWTNDDDVTKAIPARLTALAHDELDCPGPIEVTYSAVPMGGGLLTKGCERLAVYTCTCARTPIDACHA